VNVILHPADDQRLAIVFGEDAAELTMQFLPQRFIAQIGAPILGRENRVDEDLCQGLRHGRSVSRAFL
jgi:hypothetical protein